MKSNTKYSYLAICVDTIFKMAAAVSLLSPAAPKARDGRYCNAPRPSVVGGGCGFFFLEKQVFLISRFMLFSTLKINIEKCPFTYWLNGRWFLQVVERDSWNLYPLYPLFPCYDFVSQSGGGGSVLFFSHFMLYPTFLEKKIWEYKPIISHLMFSSCFFCMLEILKSAPSLTATG